jgi:hypothetical protein
MLAGVGRHDIHTKKKEKQPRFQREISLVSGSAFGFASLVRNDDGN